MSFHFSPKLLTDGLVWYLDAANPKSYISGSTTWYDMSKNDYSGDLVNGPTLNTDKCGFITFDGVDDYLLSDTFPTQNIDHISIFTKPSTTINSSSSGKALILLRKNASASGQPDSNWYVAFGGVTNQLTNEYITIATLATPTNRRTGVNDGGSLLADNWYNVCLNWNGSFYDIYVNGVKKTVVSSPSGHVPRLTNPNCFVLGTRTGDGSVNNIYYDGSYSSVMLYNKSLTETEIKQNYNTLKHRFGL
jgi:hypothetical protein